MPPLGLQSSLKVIKIIANAILNPLLGLPDWLAILIFATVVVISTNLVYKFMLDRNKVSEIKTRMKEVQEKFKESKDEKYLNEMNELNSKYMRMTFRPMMVTMLIILLLFPWLRANYGDIVTDKNFIMVDGRNLTFERFDGGIILDGKNVTFGEKITIDGKKYVVREDGEKIIFSRVIIESKIPLPITGRDWGWMAYYIVVSVPLSMVLRKVMGVNL